MSTAPQDAIRRAGQALVRHQSLAIPLAYVALILLGMFHMALYFAQFRLNALDFADPSDFLLAPMADPLVIVVSIAPFPIFALLRKFDRWFAGRIQRVRQAMLDEERRARLDRQYRVLQVVGTVLWILAFSLNYAQWRGDRVKEGRSQRMRVQLTNGERLGSAADSTVALIGTTTQYAFFYAGRRDSSTGAPAVTVVPVGNVARMDLTPSRRHRAR